MPFADMAPLVRADDLQVGPGPQQSGPGPDPLPGVIEGELHGYSFPRSSPSPLHSLEVSCLGSYGTFFLFVTSVLFLSLLLPILLPPDLFLCASPLLLAPSCFSSSLISSMCKVLEIE